MQDAPGAPHVLVESALQPLASQQPSGHVAALQALQPVLVQTAPAAHGAPPFAAQPHLPPLHPSTRAPSVLQSVQCAPAIPQFAKPEGRQLAIAAQQPSAQLSAPHGSATQPDGVHC
jgi:hypothetical protein